MEENYEDGEVKTSKYNEAFNQTLRLHELWMSCNLLSTSGKLLQWNWKLDAVWRELYPDARRMDESKKKEEDKFSDMKLKIDNEILKVAKDKAKLYQALVKKDEFMRWLQFKSGKGTQMVDEFEDDME